METLFPWRFTAGSRSTLAGKIGGPLVACALNALHLAVYVATIIAVIEYVPGLLP